MLFFAMSMLCQYNCNVNSIVFALNSMYSRLPKIGAVDSEELHILPIQVCSPARQDILFGVYYSTLLNFSLLIGPRGLRISLS